MTIRERIEQVAEQLSTLLDEPSLEESGPEVAAHVSMAGGQLMLAALAADRRERDKAAVARLTAMREGAK